MNLKEKRKPAAIFKQIKKRGEGPWEMSVLWKITNHPRITVSTTPAGCETLARLPGIPGIWCPHIFLLLANHFRLIKKSSYYQRAKTLSPPCKVTSSQQDKISVNFPSWCACWPVSLWSPICKCKNYARALLLFCLHVYWCKASTIPSQKRVKSRPASARRSRPASSTQEFKTSLRHSEVQGQP